MNSNHSWDKFKQTDNFLSNFKWKKNDFNIHGTINAAKTNRFSLIIKLDKSSVLKIA